MRYDTTVQTVRTVRTVQAVTVYKWYCVCLSGVTYGMFMVSLACMGRGVYAVGILVIVISTPPRRLLLPLYPSMAPRTHLIC